MATQWAVDLGTTNTVVAVAEERGVRVVHLPGLSREQPSEQAELIPSALCIFETLRRWLFFRRRVQQVFAGQEALDQNLDGRLPCFCQSFKRHLGSQSHRPVFRLGNRDVSVREVARLFLREVLAAAQRQIHEPIRDLTMPSPVGFYEPYRAELQAIARSLGIHRFRTLDEPVAAALGYGVNVGREETLLVVDFGGGTLNLAAIRLGPQTGETGAAPVLAKHMVSLGGSDVDRWLVEHLVPPAARELPAWRHDMLWEAMRVKEEVSRDGAGEFRWSGLRRALTRDELSVLLKERGLYEQLRLGLSEIQRQLEVESPLTATVDEVLLVGGSTLLPGVPAVVDDAFPHAVVRHDPIYLFTGVALGAARFAGGAPVDDFIYHDYALAVQNERTHKVEYELLTPRRTRYPTSPDFAVRYYADFPGMTEMRFSICEVGRLGQQPVGWEERPNGNRYWAPQSEEERAQVVELNPADPSVPLHPRGQGTSPRLRVTYSINADRWLCTTVDDLVRKESLHTNEPVVRLR